MQSGGARVLGPSDGRAGMLGSMGVRFMLAGHETGGGFSLVEHPIPPRALAAPLHRHSREDEYSFVLEGRLGALLGDEVEQFEVEGASSAPTTYPITTLEQAADAGLAGQFVELVLSTEGQQVLADAGFGPP